MFERRLKILLAMPIFAGLVVLARLYQLQVVQGGDFHRRAEDALVAPTRYLPPLRGRVLDRFGGVLVSDEPAHDVVVHLDRASEHSAHVINYRDDGPDFDVDEHGAGRAGGNREGHTERGQREETTVGHCGFSLDQ